MLCNTIIKKKRVKFITLHIYAILKRKLKNIVIVSKLTILAHVNSKYIIIIHYNVYCHVTKSDKCSTTQKPANLKERILCITYIIYIYKITATIMITIIHKNITIILNIYIILIMYCISVTERLCFQLIIHKIWMY